MKPRIFIGSSLENKKVADAIHRNLDYEAEVSVWNHTFSPSKFTIEDLINTLDKTDYGIYVFAPEDQITLRGKDYLIARDNVIFELGMSMAKLGREKTFIVMPRNAEDFCFLTDLKGISVITYDGNRGDGNLMAALSPACNEIRESIKPEVQSGFCEQLRRFDRQEALSFLGTDCDTRVSKGKGYRFIVYMFLKEHFEEFVAFDLAFGRWEELLRSRRDQTFNVSDDIFDAMDEMFKDKRCKRFRRILVLTERQMMNDKTTDVLGLFLEKEREWLENYNQIEVETRIFIYPIASINLHSEIALLHDFAIFTDKSGSVGIVETTLTSPLDHIEKPNLLITNLKKECDFRRIKFDEFWLKSKTIPDVLQIITKTDKNLSNKGPAGEAFEIFVDNCPEIKNNQAVIIEAGYFDLRTPEDEDRFSHLNDAFWLFESIRNKFPDFHTNIFLDAFINDFSGANICHLLSCYPKILDINEQERISIDLIDKLKKQYSLLDVKSENVEVFGMKKTADSARTILKKSIKEKHNKISLEYQGDTTRNIILSTEGEEILLGYLDETNPNTVTPRCTALMAQHYFDLFHFVKKNKPNLQDLWIFDFNRILEGEAVKFGAEAAFALYSFPKNFKLSIVNCIYNRDGKTGETRNSFLSK